MDEPGLSTKDGRIHLGGNSGYQAIGLAYLWGAARIVLLGYDMQRTGGRNHHHPDHVGLPNLGADLKEWCRRMVQLGQDLRAQGVEVINATRETALTCFERRPIEVALGGGKRTAALLIPAGLLPAEHEAFRSGLEAAGYRGETAERGGVSAESPSGADVSVVWGGRDKVSGTVLVAENPYLQGVGGPYCALGLGGHNGTGRVPAPRPGAWERLGMALKPWREDGGHVLVCPSRGLTTGYAPQPDGWLEKTVLELRKHTDREIRVRPHPGNKARPPRVPLEADLAGAWACVIWNSAAGVRALVEGVPVIYTAPHWICAGAAAGDLSAVEAPLMPDRLPALEQMAAAQWSLADIASGAAFRALLPELTVLCVLKTGGDYNAEYVRKLRDGVAKHLTIPHRFVCLSDVPVPCERIPLRHGWKGWWSKLEIFRPDVITGPTLYLDLDTIVVGNIDAVASIPYGFAMLNIREKDVQIGNSGAMWISKPFPHVYERFAEKPDYWMDYHLQHAHDRYMGDQAFISDSFGNMPKLHHALPGLFLSYKYDKLQYEIPRGCSVVCFGGHPRPHEAGGWVKQVWV